MARATKTPRRRRSHSSLARSCESIVVTNVDVNFVTRSVSEEVGFSWLTLRVTSSQPLCDGAGEETQIATPSSTYRGFGFLQR